ncbi:aldehyde dehydrogenase family protein [Flavobacterium sp. HSC-61S13]|uniref:aldehyde dehydrogenase family protein n=1 Tax=Flavobacterium sp. HSC-61S13 TaxID=2910963 RepID=UPI0020A0C33F|nr:aldehyde dehydrogenase family protein [Flavobacterium sp. HSC-61S13]MCP1994677.1 phenylacetaldehyde dehydrogenase [Flavobacterium sp. HSC-61S13]
MAIASDRKNIHPDAISFLLNQPKKLFIGGEWIPAQSQKVFRTINPANETVLAKIAQADKYDVDLAVKAAKKVLRDPKWSKITVHQRADYLFKIAAILEQHSEEMATIETLDNGMPLATSKYHVAYTIEIFRYFAGWITKLSSKSNVLREPIGVIGSNISHHGPLISIGAKIAAAISTGNTVVLKVSKYTPLSALRLAELIVATELPKGVINILTGFDTTAGNAINANPDLNKISLSGAVLTGKAWLSSSQIRYKQGVPINFAGKSQFMIFENADLEQSINSAMAGFTSSTGQLSIGGSQILVQQSIYDDALQMIKQKLTAIRVGDPFDPATQLGPLLSKLQLNKVSKQLTTAVQSGATMVNDAVADSFTNGYFIQPCILTNVKTNMPIYKTMVEGPIGCLIAFTDQQDAILKANQAGSSSALSIWTKDVGLANKVSTLVKTELIWINSYFEINTANPNGRFKLSGFNGEFAEEVIKAYTQVKSI